MEFKVPGKSLPNSYCAVNQGLASGLVSGLTAAVQMFPRQ